MKRRHFNQCLALSAASAFLGKISVHAQAKSWCPKLTSTVQFTGRKLEWFTHGTKPEWGAKDPAQKDTFAILHPKTGTPKGRPLYVVLHSAGHSVQSCLECTKTKGNHDIYHAPDDFCALYVDCAANRGTDWWWGALSAREMPNEQNAEKAGFELSPCEKRVMDTVNWTIQTYGIDPNRVYLCGNSMGGSGTLGLGLRHGNVFAAIKANVPAGIMHAASRMGWINEKGEAVPTEKIPFEKLPEPPICVDYSGTNDSWSFRHELLFDAMKRCRYPMIAYWGNYGHANNTEKICQVNDLIESFDWLSIRKNEAYPVFTNADCDTKVPWPNAEKSEEPGQMNAFFRWQVRSDSANSLEMDLWISSNEELKSKIFQVPSRAKADVSPRRLQNLRFHPNQNVSWRFGSQSGTAKTDAQGLLTLRDLTLTNEKQTLKIWK